VAPGSQIYIWRQSLSQIGKADPLKRETCGYPLPFDKAPVYRSVVEDPTWYWLYLPIARCVGYGTARPRGLRTLTVRWRSAVVMTCSPSVSEFRAPSVAQVANEARTSER